MSDNIQNEEPVIEAEDVYVEETVTKKPKKKRSKLLLVGGIVLVVAAAWSFAGDSGTQITSTVVAPPELNTTIGGDVQQTSPEYAESLRQANDANAQLALDSGRTFIPTPEGALTPINTAVESLPEPVVEEVVDEPVSTAVVERQRPVIPQLRRVNEQPSDTQVAPAPANGSNEPPPENPYVEMIANQMGAFSSTFVPPLSNTETFDVAESAPVEVQSSQDVVNMNGGAAAPLPDMFSEEAAQSNSLERVDLGFSDQQNVSSSDQMTQESEKQTDEVFIPAGDVLYGEVIASVNSDMPLPVIAEVTVGEFKGARLKGTFATDPMSGKMVVSFSQMTTGNTTVPVSAVAIDGYTSDSAVRSGIDRRYLQRYGSIFATTFIQGLAEGLAEPEKTIITDADGNQQAIEEQRTSEEAAWNGVNASIEAISGDITDTAPKGPKVYLNSGYPIGLLFVDDLRENPISEE